MFFLVFVLIALLKRCSYSTRGPTRLDTHPSIHPGPGIYPALTDASKDKCQDGTNAWEDKCLEGQVQAFVPPRGSTRGQNFCIYSEFLSFFVLYSRILADFLSLLGKWVKLIKFEAENEFFCTWKVEKPQSITSTP